MKSYTKKVKVTTTQVDEYGVEHEIEVLAHEVDPLDPQSRIEVVWERQIDREFVREGLGERSEFWSRGMSAKVDVFHTRRKM